MASSQVGAPSMPALAQSTPFARRTMDDQSPPPEPLQRLFVPIISIDHLSQDYQDLPVDDILALGDQALLYQFEQAFCGISQNRTTKVRSQTTRDQGQMRPGRYQERNYMEQDLIPETAQALSRPTRVQSVGNSDELVLPPGWFPSNPAQQSCQLEQNSLHEYFKNLLQNPLSQPIVEKDVFGPLVNKLYETLAILKSQPTCEVLLYLSGHGMDPGNICLVPDKMKPHPTRSEHDLTNRSPAEWYKYGNHTEAKEEEVYLEEFYCEYANVFREYSKPLGFVGGEVYAHHRGFIGVLGVLGLWCYAHHECNGDTYHHLVIVADCCFAGIWGATLERIMKCTEHASKDIVNCSSSIRSRFSVPPTNLKHLMVACLLRCGISCKLPQSSSCVTTVMISTNQSPCQMMKWRHSTRAM